MYFTGRKCIDRSRAGFLYRRERFNQETSDVTSIGFLIKSGIQAPDSIDFARWDGKPASSASGLELVRAVLFSMRGKWEYWQIWI